MPHDIGNPGATIKNPPAVFARQANIAHGPQQVNNNGMMPASEPRAVLNIPPPRGRDLSGGQDKNLSTRGKNRKACGVAATTCTPVWLSLIHI